MAERTRRIESGEQIVVGVNRFTETAPSPLERRRAASSRSTRPSRPRLVADVQRVARRPRRRRRGSARSTSCAGRPSHGANVMPATDRPGPRRRHHRRVGRRAARGVRRVPGAHRRGGRRRRRRRRDDAARRWPSGCKALPGGPPRFLVAKPGLDGHSNGAEQIAVAARDAGMEVIYQGIRLTPEQIAAVGPRRGRRRDRPVDPVGQPPRAGARGGATGCAPTGVDAPVIVGGIIPEDDRPAPAGRRRGRRLHARRTSSWRGSWPKSPTWWSATGRADRASLVDHP